MAIGNNIKQLRIRKGLTQKELAEALFVTYQAVSRWENDDVEPSIDTLNAMTGVLDCTLDELFGVKPKEEEKSEQPVEKQVITEKVIVQEAQPILAVCEECNKPIYDPNDLHRSEETKYAGRTKQIVKRVLCSSCEEKRLAEIEKKEEANKKKQLKKLKKERIHSFIWSTLAAIICIALSIGFFVTKDTGLGVTFLVISVFAFTLVSCLILQNTYISELWMSIVEWGFVRTPGVIMEWSLNGIIAGIILKGTLWLLAELIGLFFVLLACVIAMPLSLFTYPFALKRNLNGYIHD